MSLAMRLSAFFLGILALVLLGFSLALYLVAWVYLCRQVDERLTASLEALAACVETETDGLEWDPSQRHLSLGEDQGIEQVRWEIRNERGVLIARSANLHSRGFESTDANVPTGAWSADWSGQPWRFARRELRFNPAAAPFSSPPGGTEPGPVVPRYQVVVLTTGVSLTPLRVTLLTLTAALASLSVALWLVAAVLGRWLSRRALAPIVRMADASRDMGATNLSQRLPDPGTHDELAELHRAFNGLLNRLQEAFERQRQFTGNASHQLRTPLTAMLGQTELALRRERSAEDYRQALSLVQDQALRLRQIVEALLFLARADTETDLPDCVTLDLATWLPLHLEKGADNPRAADLQLRCQTNGPLLVRAHPVLLGQLLDNLLENALKYSAVSTPVTVSARSDAGKVILSVEDVGCGFTPEDLVHVFEPFYRSPEARQRGLTGVGLGLAVARRIAAALNGTLTVESEAGRGSRFILSLAVASFAGANSAQGVDQAQPGASGMTGK
jgi:heavy metal sensor kinase